MMMVIGIQGGLATKLVWGRPSNKQIPGRVSQKTKLMKFFLRAGDVKQERREEPREDHPSIRKQERFSHSKQYTKKIRERKRDNLL